MKTLRPILLAAALTALAAPQAVAFGGPGGGGGSAPPAETDSRRRNLTQSTHYVPLPPMTASVQADYRLRGVMHIEAGLEIADARKRRRAQMMMPRLRDAYVSALSLYTGVNYRFGDVPDIDRIRALLQDATDEALGHDEAEVLLGMVIIHSD